MRTVFALAIAAAIAGSPVAAQETGPADKQDSGSLSSGQKQAMPSTRNQGENAPVGSKGSDAAGATDTPQTEPTVKKGTGGTSDPAGTPGPR